MFLVTESTVVYICACSSRSTILKRRGRLGGLGPSPQGVHGQSPTAQKSGGGATDAEQITYLAANVSLQFCTYLGLL